MRYTASAAMEDRTLRDVERWKDKIEIRLDNRQVFFLFFGSALVACLLFVLGVVVGKRLESRGRAAAPEIEDPLALLDRIAAAPGAPDEAITFPRTLIHNSNTKADKPEKKGARREPPQLEPKPPAVKAEVSPPAAPATPPPAAKAAPAAKPEPKPATAAVAPSAPTAAPVPTPVAVPVVPTKVAQKPAEVKPAKPLEKAAEAGEKKGKFALQLGSFQSREEAEAFMQKFAAAAPYVVVSDIPEKGRWYRVRVGNFESTEQAMQAKSDFERAHHQIAYVAPR